MSHLAFNISSAPSSFSIGFVSDQFSSKNGCTAKRIFIDLKTCSSLVKANTGWFGLKADTNLAKLHVFEKIKRKSALTSSAKYNADLQTILSS